MVIDEAQEMDKSIQLRQYNSPCYRPACEQTMSIETGFAAGA